MTDSNYWIEHFVSYSSGRNSGVHQATKEYEIVSVDEPPQKRSELRAEMKGIDFCISVLDSNR